MTGPGLPAHSTHRYPPAGRAGTGGVMGEEKSGGEERVAPHPVNAPCSGPRRQKSPSAVREQEA